MRNLVNLGSEDLCRFEDGIPKNVYVSPITQQALFVCESGPNTNLTLYQEGESNSWPPLPLSGCVTALADEPSIILFENGQLASVSPSDSRIIGNFESERVLAAGWSTDEEILCLITETREEAKNELSITVMMLSRTMELLGEHTISESDLSLSKHVSVGWGKSETQFQGRGAHALRDPTMPKLVDSGTPSPNDSGEAFVSWRGDGEFVAVSLMPENERRCIRIFDRTCTLKSVTEPVNGLEAPIAWKPSGATIAAAQNDVSQVIFFEQNGLRRSNMCFATSGVVTALQWSPNSELLAVTYANRVELWCTKNYHWYCKQVLTGKSDSKFGKLLSCEWSQVEDLSLIVMYSSGVQQHSFAWDVATSYDPSYSGSAVRSQTPLDIVAVIAKDEVSVTPFAKCAIPPPMSHSKISVRDAVHAAASATGHQLAVAAHEGFVVANWTDKGFEIIEKVQVEGTPRQVAFSSDGSLLCLYDTDYGSEIIRYSPKELIDVDTLLPVVLVTTDFFETSDGSIFDFNGTLRGKFPSVCPHVLVSADWIFGLTKNYELYACHIYDDTCSRVARNVTSFVLSDQILAYTTQTSEIKFIHLSNISEHSDGQAQNAMESSREIERGSLLVRSLSSGLSLILQAPRGNIEIIYPRILILGKIRECVRSNDYKNAFQLCRTHRVDLNILYDLDPIYFQEHIADVLSQIGSASNIDLFLASLKNEDFTKTKYLDSNSNTGETAESSNTTSADDKVNRVCQLVMAAATNNINKITCYAYLQPPSLGGALKACQTEDDIAHLVYLTDTELLYKTAMGIYDLKLTLAVAQKAQKDPKEYLAFLKSRELESPMRMRFNIDVYLARYPKALEHLLRDEEATDDEIIEFVTRRDLSQEAIDLLEDDSSSRAKLLRNVHAESLFSKGLYSRAALYYELSGETARAVKAYIQAGDWRRALSLDKTQAEAAVEACIDQSKFGEAGDLYAYYLKDPESAIEAYVKGSRYDDAILIALVTGVDEKAKAELVVTLDEALRSTFGSVRQFLADCDSQVKSQIKRLREVREAIEKDRLGFFAETGDMADDVSLAGTVTTRASFMTQYTDKSGGTAKTGASRRTQKNKRRQDRKIARGKKGTIYEESYLIASLSRLTNRFRDESCDAANLVTALSRRNMGTYSLEIIKAHHQLCDILKENQAEIYSGCSSLAESDLPEEEKKHHIKPDIPEPLSSV